MEVIHSMLAWNEILTVSILGWLTAQLIKTTISSLLAGKLQLERMVGDGGMPSAHSATVCAMVVATGRIEGVHSTLFAVACVVAIITMHDAMGVRHETGDPAAGLRGDDRRGGGGLPLPAVRGDRVSTRQKQPGQREAAMG